MSKFLCLTLNQLQMTTEKFLKCPAEVQLLCQVLHNLWSHCTAQFSEHLNISMQSRVIFFFLFCYLLCCYHQYWNKNYSIFLKIACLFCSKFCFENGEHHLSETSISLKFLCFFNKLFLQLFYWIALF